MTQLMVGRTINDKDSKGDDYAFVIPDMMKMMNTPVRNGDEVLIPVSSRDGGTTFWESGGRNQSVVSSVGTIIAGQNDQLLDAILFNKLSKMPNGKQALIALKPGYRLYAGKISVRHNVMAPSIKVIRLIYNGVDETNSNSSVRYGKFTVDELFTDYKTIKGCFPGERLVEKLFSKNVMKPYYANGWSVSNIANIKNKDIINNAYIRLMNIETVLFENTIANQFLDTVEEAIVRMANKNLSAVFQCIDFEAGIVSLKPMIGVKLSDISGTLSNATVETTYTIPIENMISCYNQNILFNSTDIPMLEMGLTHDDKYAITFGDRKFYTIRGFRG